MWGQVPMLEIDGHTLVQSMAELRYLARKHKIYGDDDWEASLIDQAADGIRDFLGHFSGLPWSADRAAAEAAIREKWMPKYLPSIERLLANNPHNARSVAAVTGGEAAAAGGGAEGGAAVGPSESVRALGPIPEPALFLVGKRMSFADVTLTEVLLYCRDFEATSLDAYPLAKAHLAAMTEWAPLKAFLASDKRMPSK